MDPSQSLCVIRYGTAAACLLVLRDRVPPRVWMAVCCECCLLSGRGLCDGPIPRSGDSYRMCVAIGCNYNDLLEEVKQQRKKKERTLIKTLSHSLVNSKKESDKRNSNKVAEHGFQYFILGRESDLYLCLYNQLFALFHYFLSF